MFGDISFWLVDVVPPAVDKRGYQKKLIRVYLVI